MLWENGGIGPSAIVVAIFGFLVLPLAPAVVVGWICGRWMRGVSLAGGLMLGVFCGIAMIALQPMVLAYIRWDVGVLINPGMYLVVAAVSAALSASVCYLWGRVVVRRGT